MSDIPTRIEINCETLVETVIPLTPEEIAQMEIDAAAFAEAKAVREAEEAAKAEAKASAEAKLAALGLTSEEVAAILER
jgi:hypothetical protein